MSPRGYSERRIEHPCEACGALLPAQPREKCYARFFCCTAKTATLEAGKRPEECWLIRNQNSPDTLAALTALPIITCNQKGEKAEILKARGTILMRYISEVGTGEPSLAWYRSILGEFDSRVVSSALSPLPYWKSDELRIPSLVGIQPVDQLLSEWDAKTDAAVFASLLRGYIEHQYELMEFGFKHGLIGKSAAIKPNTIKVAACKISHYLNWLHDHDHRDLREAGRSWLSRYMVEFGRGPAYGYLINNFYKWARTKNTFVPALKFSRKHGKSARDAGSNTFEALTLEESRVVYKRICECKDPIGKFFAFMSLLYCQPLSAAITLRRSVLHRSTESGCWIIRQDDNEEFELEPEVSASLDECLALADRHNRLVGQSETEFVFPGKFKLHISLSAASEKLRLASGHKASILRRTGITNMFRSGEKTMGTIALRDRLKVDIATIHKGIRAAGFSVNAPLDRDAAEEFRRAFLTQEDE